MARHTVPLVVTLLVTIAFGVLAGGPAVATSADAPANVVVAEPPVDLRDLLTLEGDQIVVVPDGVYDGITVRAPHPGTDGPLEGWLVLQAENRNGAVITGDLVLDEGTSRVLFVGFRFENARVFNHGEQIAYWYTDHVFPDVDWYESGRPIPRQFFARYPATDISVMGADFHDGVASPINVSGVDRLEIIGTRIYDVAEPEGSDPEDLSHLNTISLLGGDVTDMVISQTSLVGARANHQTDHGDVVGLRYEDVWYEGAFGSAFQFNATNGNRIIDGERVRVRSWGHVGDNPRDRLDIVAGEQLEPGARPAEVDVADVDLELAAPPSDAIDPATAWRDQHPYDSWLDHYGWTRIEPVQAQEVLDDDEGSSTVRIAAIAAVAVVPVAAVLMLLRRRRRLRVRFGD